MVIKSMSRKSQSFGQALRYFHADEKEIGAVLRHNLRGRSDDIQTVEQEFLENSGFAKPRKNGVTLFHEILSFSHLDKEQITESILHDLTREYLRLRAPDALAYAKPHLNAVCPHVHILISGNRIMSKKQLRITKRKFEQIKLKLEAYQQKHYPQLKHSLVHTKAKSRSKGRKKRQEREMERRVDKMQEATHTRRQGVKEKITACLQASKSQEEFVQKLDEQKLRFYQRGKNFAVEDMTRHLKYRFSSLEIHNTYLETREHWQRTHRRVQELRNLTREAQGLEYQRLNREQDRETSPILASGQN